MFKKAIPTWKNIPAGFRWMIITFVTWFAWGLLDSLINKEALYRSLFTRIPSLLLKIRIPSLIFLLAFAAVALLLWRLNKKIKKMGATPGRRNLIFANNAYWTRSVGIIAPEGPFCPKCCAEDKEARMINTYGKYHEVKCPVCGLTTISSEPTFNQQIFGREGL
jgi:hypothetical protein